MSVRNKPSLHDGELWLSLESIPHAVQEVDTKGILRFCNAAHCSMHGYQTGELTGQEIWGLLATDKEKTDFRNAIDQRINSHPLPVSYQTRHRRKDGSLIDVQIDWSYKYGISGDIEGFISIVTDITQETRDRRALESAREVLETTTARNREQLAAANAKLRDEIERRRIIEAAMRNSKRLASVGVLAAGIAHEINNPIGAALNSAETALAICDDPHSKPMVEECLQTVVHSARRCSTIVRDLMKFANQEPTEKSQYELNDVIGRALRAVRKVTEEANVTFQTELTDEPLLVVVNLLEMEIALGNLVQNAIEASRNELHNIVTIRTLRSGTTAILEIEDQGCGIAETDLTHIFDPFFTLRKDSGGTGLGLSIVYAIMRDQHGEIEVQSQVDIGTKFVLYLPVAGQTV